MENFKIQKNEIAIIFYNLFLIFLIVSDGRYYIDDLRRSIDGNPAWLFDGRPLSSFLFEMLCVNAHIVDCFPIPQILAALVLSGIEIAFCRKFFPEKRWLGTVSCLFISANPFLFQNLSYHFDSISMIMSMAFAAFPFVYTEKKNREWIFLICLLMSLLFYQASSSIFLLFSLFEISKSIVMGWTYRKIYEHSARRAIQFFIAAFVYFVIIHFIVPKTGYSSQHSSFGSGIGIFYHAIDNLVMFFGLIFNASAGGMFVALKIVMLIFVMSIFYVIGEYVVSWHRKLLTVIFLLSFPIVALAPMCILKDPIFMVRVLLSLGFIPALYAAFIKPDSGKFLSRSIIVIGCMALFYSVQICAVYADASRTEESFEDGIAWHMSYDISNVQAENDIRNFYFVSSIPLNPVAQNDEVILPFIGYMVFPYFEDWSINPSWFLNHYGITIPMTVSVNDNSMLCKNKLLLQSKFYDLRLDGTTLIVDLSKGNQCK